MPSTEKQFSGNFRGTKIEKGIILSNIICTFIHWGGGQHGLCWTQGPKTCLRLQA